LKLNFASITAAGMNLSRKTPKPLLGIETISIASNPSPNFSRKTPKPLLGIETGNEDEIINWGKGPQNT